MKKEDLKSILIEWEQFKKSNWWESDAIDVEKVLMDKFLGLALNGWDIGPKPVSPSDNGLYTRGIIVIDEATDIDWREFDKLSENMDGKMSLSKPPTQ